MIGRAHDWFHGRRWSIRTCSKLNGCWLRSSFLMVASSLLRLLPDVVPQPPSLLASLTLPTHAASVHQNLPALVAHCGKASLP